MLTAYIDESGQRAVTPASSDHFVLTAVVLHARDHKLADDLLATMRADLRRRPGDTLHWRNVKHHAQRLRAAQLLGEAEFLTAVSVVVCKRHLPPAPHLDEDAAYLYTLRYLIERLSWLGRDRQTTCHYTLAHVVRFRLSTLRAYEQRLRQGPSSIAWRWMGQQGGAVDQPSRVEYLQLADFAASATATAFEPDRWGNTEQRYLREFAARLYRRGTGANALTSYGLKIHPWNTTTKAAYPWVAAL